MRQIYTIVLVISFISVLFGGFMMTAYGSHHASICLATRLNGSEAPCPESDPIGFANFHAQALRQFSSFVLVDSPAILYAMALIVFMFFSLLLGEKFEQNLTKLALVSFTNTSTKSHPPQVNKLNWLSLHENSPSYF